MSSLTFYKYCGNGFGEERPLEVGQKQAIVKVSRKFTFFHQYLSINYAGYGEKCAGL